LPSAILLFLPSFTAEVDDEIPSDYENLFTIVSFDFKYGRLTTAKPVRGFSGKWKIEIKVKAFEIMELTSN
jgi:hypothetical protein